MNDKLYDDLCPKPKKRYRFGDFTYIIPDPNFVIPEYFRSNDNDRINMEQVNLTSETENCSSTDVNEYDNLNSIECDSRITEVVPILQNPTVSHRLNNVKETNYLHLQDSTKYSTDDAISISTVKTNEPDVIVIDDDFEDDIDINDFVADEKDSNYIDEGKGESEDDEMDWDYSSREDMHGKFRGFLVDDGDEYLDEKKHLSQTTIFKMYETLRDIFGHDDFRHRQKAAITASLSGEDTFILMPTGAGKSLCYQLPAAIEDGLTVVVSPLRALIDDQCDKMNKLGIRTEKLTSDVNQSKSNKIYENLVNLNSNIKLLYVTPEKIAASPNFIDLLEELHKQRKLCRFVIDEVHCVSQWGHDFRPDYAKLRTLRERFNSPRVPIIALTATATPKIVTDTKRLLKIESSKLFISTFVRPNLKYDVIDKSAKNAKTLLEDIFRTYPTGSGILFCFSKNDCNNAKKLVETLGESAVIYHAGLNDKERSEAQQIWMSGRVRIVCATIAFGMGIDKSDVRFVIHMSMPKSIESYYQESGRAGRDGFPSYCCILYNYTDCIKLRKFVEDTIKNDKGIQVAKSDGVKKMQHANINEMIVYCESVSGCQRKILVEHFGEIYDSGNCKADQNTCCRNCSKSREKIYYLYEMTEIVTLILQSIERMSLTVKQLSECLKGKIKVDDAERGQRISQLPMYNKGGFLRDTDASRLIIKLITDGFAYEKIREVGFGRNNKTFVGYVLLSDEGEKFLISTCKPKFYIHMPPIKFKYDGDMNQRFVVKVDVKEAEVVKEKFKIKHMEVYQCAKFKIESLRTQLTKEERLLNPSDILTDEAVDQIAALLPRTNTELLSIDGMTRLKVRKYGGRIMTTLNEFWRMIDKNDQVKMTRELDMFLADNSYHPPIALDSNSNSNRKTKHYYRRGKSYGGVKKNETVRRSNKSNASASSTKYRRQTTNL